MRRLILEGTRDVEVREAAIEAVRQAGVRPHDHLGELAALFRFVRDSVRFTRDPAGVELLSGPRYTLTTLAGDCDDRAVLLGALARSIGIPARLRFRVVGADPMNPGRYSHVYLVANIRGRDVPLDPTYEGTPMGWQLRKVTRVTDFPI